MSRVVDHFSLPQRIRRTIQSHQRNLVKAEKVRISATENNDFFPEAYKAMKKGEYHLGTLFRSLENPALTAEQQRKLTMEVAYFLLTNYQSLYVHVEEIKGWISANANPALRDEVLVAAKGFDRSADNLVFTSINQILLDLSTREDIGFSPETLAYFDALPLEEKVNLVGSSGELPRLHNPEAQSLVESWGKSVRLHSGRKKIQEKLNGYELSKDISSLEQYISSELGLDGALGYYNQHIMILLQMRESKDTTSYQDPLVQQIYILAKHRLKNALSIPDAGRPREDSRLREPSAVAILSIFGEIGRRPLMLSETGWVEFRTLVNQNFDPQLVAYLVGPEEVITI